MRIIKLPFVLDNPVEPRAYVLVMISMEEGNTLKASILELRKESGELEEKLYRGTCEKNQVKRDLNQTLEQLKRSEDMTKVEEVKGEQAYVDLRVIISSLRAHKD